MSPRLARALALSERARQQRAHGRGRPQPDKGAIADKAAHVCVDEGVTVKNALTRFKVGRTRLLQAIAKLRAERAAQRTGGAPCGCAPDQVHSKHHQHQRAYELSDSARPRGKP